MPMLTGNLLSKGLKNDGTVNSYLGHKKEARNNKSLNLLLVSTTVFCHLLRKEGEKNKKLTLPSPLVVFPLQVVRFQVENSREAGF